jgi:hypothetical protein
MADESKKSGVRPDEWLVQELLGELHSAALTDLPAIRDRCASMIGCDSMVVYLADIQQRKLLPLTPGMTHSTWTPPPPVRVTCSSLCVSRKTAMAD